ncbi:MAG: peptide deformylase [Bacteroidales bacterium]|nr:peptide deformylase [Bacteroidales bacterium]
MSYKPIIAVIALISAVYACKSNKTDNTTNEPSGITFTQEELMILNQSDSVMYLTVIGDKSDSLILRKVSRDFTEQELQSQEVKTLARNLLATVQDPSQDGVGISAPQVGLNLRMIAVMRYDKEDKPIEPYANVHITYLSQNIKSGPEGCLSVPNYRGIVPRSDSIIVSYYDLNSSSPKTDTIGGYTAIIFQHETDHLEGILYIDRADSVFFNQKWADERKQYEQKGAYTKPAWWPYK